MNFLTIKKEIKFFFYELIRIPRICHFKLSNKDIYYEMFILNAVIMTCTFVCFASYILSYFSLCMCIPLAEMRAYYRPPCTTIHFKTRQLFINEIYFGYLFSLYL